MSLRSHALESGTVALLTARGNAAKPVIEARSGPSISLAEAAVRMKIAEEVILSWVRGGHCVGYVGLSRDEGMRLPEWQFAAPEPFTNGLRPCLRPSARTAGDYWIS